jgi:16S rRNA (cytidine1402-2'-O)-methyltransferase
MGILYIVSTPVGNLEDITLRALRILKEVDLIACEDTRHTSKLLSRYSIGTPRESYHKFNEESRTPQIIGMLREGKNIALVSDSGTPLVSDPGYELVSSCRAEGIQVIPIPGPSAPIAALIASGLPADTFFFAGFLPARGSMRRRKLEELASIPSTLVVFEAPHRLLASLEDMIAIFGPRRASMARELTKIHEEFLHGTLPELLEILQARSEIPGEITLVIEPGEKISIPLVFPDSIKQHLEEEIRKTGLARNEALKAVARQRGITRRDAYAQLNDELQSVNDRDESGGDALLR